jgi:hypothetical protein
VVGTFVAFLCPNVVNGNYAYNIYIQVGSFHARDYSIEPSSNGVDYATYNIAVRGGASIPFTSQHSVSSGFVQGDAPGVPGAILVERTAFLGRDIVGIDVALKLQFFNNFNEVINLPSDPNNTDIFGIVITFHDALNNIGAIHLGVRTRLPSTVNRKLPQAAPQYQATVVNNPLVPISQYTVLPIATTFNSLPYYAYWNGPWSQL